MARKQMGSILLENNIISQKDLELALQRQKKHKKPLGKILEEMDIILEEDIALVLSKQFDIPYVRQFSRSEVPDEVLAVLDGDTALKHQIFPLKLEKKILYLAMANPLDMGLQSDLSFKLGLRVSPCVATPSEIKAAIKKYYLAELDVDIDNQGLNILVVDNQEFALNAVEAGLVKEGFTVHKARNGVDGLKMATQLHPNLIITDIPLPLMDGIEMFRAIRMHSDMARIPVIALSAKSTAEEEYRILEMGFFDFIAKPVNATRLLARVKRAIWCSNRGRLDGSHTSEFAFF